MVTVDGSVPLSAAKTRTRRKCELSSDIYRQVLGTSLADLICDEQGFGRLQACHHLKAELVATLPCGMPTMSSKAPVCQEIFNHALEGVPTGDYEQMIKVSIDAALSRTTPGCIAFWLHSAFVAGCPLHRTLAASSF